MLDFVDLPDVIFVVNHEIAFAVSSKDVNPEVDIGLKRGGTRELSGIVG
jgi:hypothetical protein